MFKVGVAAHIAGAVSIESFRTAFLWFDSGEVFPESSMGIRCMVPCLYKALLYKVDLTTRDDVVLAGSAFNSAPALRMQGRFGAIPFDPISKTAIKRPTGPEFRRLNLSDLQTGTEHDRNQFRRLNWPTYLTNINNSIGAGRAQQERPVWSCKRDESAHDGAALAKIERHVEGVLQVREHRRLMD